MESSEFQRRFFQGLIHDCYEYKASSTRDADYLTFGTSASSRIKMRLKDCIHLIASRKGFVRRRFGIEHATERLMWILENMDGLERFYNLLQDDYSKQLLIELLKYRVLGGYHVKLPLNDKKYWDQYSSVDKKFLKERRTIRTGKWYLNRYRLQGLNGPLDFHGHPVGILNTFLLEHYAYKKGGRVIRVQPGDMVIDAGSCWGEVALYFADHTGAEGKVYCFEFTPDNLEILEQNISLNQHLADRIEVVSKALWDQSEEILSYGAHGPSTSLVRDTKRERTLEVSTLSIDDFVKDEGIARVDFIKMDIEGAELRALQGAEKTIRTFKPKLAISLYHKEDDFIVIPDYLDKLGLGYEFFLDHFTIHSWETVLFASPRTE
jgi:FkbM family methyltransferase